VKFYRQKTTNQKRSRCSIGLLFRQPMQNIFSEMIWAKLREDGSKAKQLKQG
jgi:hypothetical protein